MIFILDIILIINILIAYKAFKNYIAPPVLLGSGMLIASLVATCYYSEWKMYQMLPDSVLAIGLGTLLYTITAIFCNKKQIIKITAIPQLNVRRINLTLTFIVLFTFVNCLLKYKYYKQTFGFSLSFSELLFAARIDSWSGENLLVFPKYVYWLSYISEFSLYISSWILAFILIYSKQKYKKTQFLVVLHLLLVSFEGILSGAKGAIISPFFRFALIYFLMYISCHNMKRLSNRTLFKMLCVLVVFIMSFKSLSTFIGRQTDDTNNTSMLAEYCGAEIKNFDIYMHGKDGNKPGKYFGEYTFANYYRETKANFQKDNGAFQKVGNFELGNVYTQYFQFHIDFGMIGVFVMSILLSLISMFIYNKGKSKSNKINCFMLIYSSIAFPILMGFFSSQFTELVFTPYFVKFVIILFVITALTNKYLLKGKFSYE